MNLQELIKKYGIAAENNIIDLEYIAIGFDYCDIEDLEYDDLREAIIDYIYESCNIITYAEAFKYLQENDHNFTLVKEHFKENYGNSIPLSEVSIEKFATIALIECELEKVEGIVSAIFDAIKNEFNDRKDEQDDHEVQR